MSSRSPLRPISFPAGSLQGTNSSAKVSITSSLVIERDTFKQRGPKGGRNAARRKRLDKLAKVEGLTSEGCIARKASKGCHLHLNRPSQAVICGQRGVCVLHLPTRRIADNGNGEAFAGTRSREGLTRLVDLLLRTAPKMVCQKLVARAFFRTKTLAG